MVSKKRVVLVCLVLILIVTLAGCSLRSAAVPSGKSKTAYYGKRGTKPYTIRGKTYYPLQSAHGFREEGLASWYGRDFHGKPTASGVPYNMYGMTAAHKVLPLGTKVRVTNQQNGRSIIVDINDRGPFVANRVIDLSHTGAKQLGILGPGTAPVMVESLASSHPVEPPAPVPSAPSKPPYAPPVPPAAPSVPTRPPYDAPHGRYYAQVGAFSVRANAEGLAQRLNRGGTPARSIFDNAKSLWCVQVGPYASASAASQAAGVLRGRLASNF